MSAHGTHGEVSKQLAVHLKIKNKDREGKTKGARMSGLCASSSLDHASSATPENVPPFPLLSANKQTFAKAIHRDTRETEARERRPSRLLRVRLRVRLRLRPYDPITLSSHPTPRPGFSILHYSPLPNVPHLPLHIPHSHLTSSSTHHPPTPPCGPSPTL